MEIPRYQLASWPDEENLVGEILLDDEHAATVLLRDGGPVLLIHASPDEKTLNLGSFIEMLSEIPARLGRAPDASGEYDSG